jgi:SAM-dependent methyltransferase
VVDLAGRAPVIEVGTGPGHVAAFLAEAGADVTGLDITPEMVDEARRRYPGVSYQVGDLRRLIRPTTHDGWGAVLAWYTRSSISRRPSWRPRSPRLRRPLTPERLARARPARRR